MDLEEFKKSIFNTLPRETRIERDRDCINYGLKIGSVPIKCADEALAAAERAVGPRRGLVATLALAMAFMGSALEAWPVLDMIIKHVLEVADELARRGKTDLAKQYIEDAKILSSLDLRGISYECPRPAHFWPLRVSTEEMTKAAIDRVLQRFKSGNIYVVDFPIAPLAEFLHYSYAELDDGTTLLGDPDEIRKVAPNAKIVNRKINNIGEYTTFLFIKYGDINAAIAEAIRTTGLPYEFIAEEVLEYLAAKNTSPKVLAYLVTYPYEFGKQVVRDAERWKKFEEWREIDGALEIISEYIKRYRQPPPRLKYAFARPDAAEYTIRNIKEEVAIGIVREARRWYRRYRKRVHKIFLSVEAPKEHGPRIRQTLTPEELEKFEKSYKIYVYPRKCQIISMSELEKFFPLINRIAALNINWDFRDVVRAKITPKYSRVYIDYIKQIYLPPQLGYINRFINTVLEMMEDENPIALTAYINLMYETGYFGKVVSRLQGESGLSYSLRSTWNQIVPNPLNVMTMYLDYNIIRNIAAHVERQLILQNDIYERAQLVEEVLKKLSGIQHIERPDLLSYAITVFPKESIAAAYALGGIGAALVMATMYLGHAGIWDEWKRRRKRRIETATDDPIGRALIAYINGDVDKERLKSIIPPSLLSQALARPMDIEDEDLLLKILRAIFDAGVTDEYRALYEAVLMGAAVNPELLAKVLEGHGMADALAALGHYELPIEVSEVLRKILVNTATRNIEERRKALLEGDILLGDKPLAEIVAEISPIYALLRKGWENPAEVDAAIERTLEIYKIGGLSDKYFQLAEGDVEGALREFGERLKGEWARDVIVQIADKMPEPRILSLYYKAIFAAAAREVEALKGSLAEIVSYGAFFALPIYVRIYRLAVEHGIKEVAQLVEGLT